MRMYGCELKKFLSNKFVLFFLVVVIAIDIGISFNRVLSEDDDIFNIDQDLLHEAIELNKNDEIAFNNEFIRIMTVIAEYNNQKLEVEAVGEVFDSDNYTHMQKKQFAFMAALGYKYYTENYEIKIKSVITAAEKNIADYESVRIGENTFLYRNQENVISIYTESIAIALEYESVKGWNEYFSFLYSNLLIIIFLLIAIPNIVLIEENTGLNKIISTTKKGQFGLFKAKFLTCITITSLLTLLLSILPLGIVALTEGLSTANSYIQSIETFAFCPIVATIGEVFLYSVCIKLLVYNSISVLILFIATLFGRYQHTFITSLTILIIQYIIYTTEFLNYNNFFALTNIFFSVDTSAVLMRYYGVDIFGFAVSHLKTITFLYAFILVLFGTACAFVYSKLIRIKIFSVKEKSKNIVLEKAINFIKSIRIPVPHNLFSYELYKLLIAKKMIIVIIGVVVLKVFVSDIVYTFEISGTEKIYKNYMIKLEGEMSEEKREFVISEREHITEVMNSLSLYQARFQENTISSEEYSKFMSEYNIAEIKNKALQRVESHVEYIDKMEVKGVDAYFVYETGWSNLFFKDFDYILFFLVLIIFSGIYADEHRLDIVQILRTTKKGRRKFFRIKLELCIGLTTVLILVFGSIDAHFLSSNTFPLETAPIASLEKFGDVSGHLASMSISEFLPLALMTRFITLIILSVIILSLSQLLKQQMAVLGVTLVGVLLPFALIKFGLAEAGYIAITNLLSGAEYYTLSASAGILSDFGLAVIFISIIITVTCFVYIKAYKKWVI